MTRRKVLIVSILTLVSSWASAQSRMPDTWFFNHFRVGMEWGYSQCFFLYRNYNIFSEEGYRIHEQYDILFVRPNGVISGQVGVDFARKFNVAIYAGYIGVGEDNRLYPLQLRASFFPHTTAEQGVFAYLQGGPAWHTLSGGYNLGWMGVLGSGWRFPLSADCNLDLLVGFKCLWDHPLIPNPDGPGYTPAHNIRRNDAGYCALDLTIAVNF